MKQVKKVLCLECQKEFSKSNINRHFCTTKYKNELNDIKELYKNGIALKEIRKKYSKKLIDFALRGIRRSRSEASKLAHKRDAENYKHSDAEKKILSEKLKLAHKEGRHLGWAFINRNINRRSYPEKYFYELFKSKRLFEKHIIKEKFAIGKYFLDFAFIDIN